MLGSLTRRLGLVLLFGGLVMAVAGSPAVAVSSAPPHIVAKPNHVMINTMITLKGKNFPARTSLTIAECASTNWVVVAEHPCVTDNQISVVTDARGRFTAPFRVELCGGKRGPEPTSQICYIGNPHPQGVDTVALLGAARVIVTYP